MKNPDYIKIAQYLHQVDFYINKIRNQIDAHVKEQQSDLHKFSDDGKEYFKKENV
jgi:hypothetical protein